MKLIMGLCHTGVQIVAFWICSTNWKKALEWGVSALLCSWDVKRAFDSISRTAIRMALLYVIRMIHEMEIEGVTVVRTPLTQYVYDTEGMKGLRKQNERFPGIIKYTRNVEYRKVTLAAR